MDDIILIGFMGAGKSTVGRKLEKHLNLPLIDTDSYIEAQEGMKISDIFAKEGEEVFRSMETASLKTLMHSNQRRILSCGGGLPLRKENAELLKQMGTVFFLDISAQTVEKRLKNDTTRPLLQGENVRERIEALLGQRRALYEQAADYTIVVDSISSAQVCDKIIGVLEKKA